MFYLKLFVLLIWMVICSILGMVYAVFRWGNLNVNRDYARVFSWVGLKIVRFKVDIEGLEHLEGHEAAMYIANHQSGLDMLTFGKLYPKNTVVIGKKEVAWFPVFGIFYLAAGNLIIDRKNTTRTLESLKKIVQEIKRRKFSLWVFPEGTRNSKSPGLLPFKRGAFHVAAQAEIPIVPIVSGSLAPLANWKGRRLSAGTLKIRVLAPISTAGVTKDDVDALCEKTRNQMIEAFNDLNKQMSVLN